MFSFEVDDSVTRHEDDIFVLHSTRGLLSLNMVEDRFLYTMDLLEHIMKK